MINNLNRRNFLKRSIAGGALMGFAGIEAWGKSLTSRNGMPYTTLGKTGLSVSRAGLGGWQIGIENTTQEKVNEIVQLALESGINYFDTAPNYGVSEERLGIALKGKRDQAVIATKTEEITYEGTWKLIRQSLERLQTDHLDIVFLHSLGNQERFDDIDLLLSKKGGLAALVEAKKQSVIRFVGVSGHSYPTLFHRLMDTGEIDVLMNAVNFVSRHIYNFEDKVWARAHQDDLGLVAMKVLGGTNDAGIRIPKQYYREALQYALFATPAHNMVIGIEKLEEVHEMVKTVKELQAINEEEYKNLYKLGLELRDRDNWNLPYGGPVT